MSFIKIGENLEITSYSDANSVVPVIDENVFNNFVRTAQELKRIAPKANDFLYFSAVMLHAAEASLINEDGTPKKDKNGKLLTAHWDKANNSWKWVCSDSSVKAYKNANGDIFPEEELIKAYKKWIGKPLCIDHKSSSVDHVRGFIVDVYYDRDRKRVIGLCALDKVNYPDLARKVSTGYSNSVSMGTAVAKAICYDCGKVARTEPDFCYHMKTKSGYGEINVDLSPIELSIVVNGADPLAKIKEVIASAQILNAYVEQKQEYLNKIAEKTFHATINLNDFSKNSQLPTFDIKANSLEDFKNDILQALGEYEKLQTVLENSEKDTNHLAYNQSSSKMDMQDSEIPNTDLSLAPPTDRFADYQNQLNVIKNSIEDKLANIQETLSKISKSYNNEKDTSMTENNLNKQGYYQGGGGVNEPTPGQKKYPVDPTQDKLRREDDKQMVGEKPFPEVGSVDGLYGDDLEKKKLLARAEAEQRAVRRAAVLNEVKEGLKSEAYHLGGGGVNEPALGKVKYPADKMQDTLREKSDKQMVGQKPFPGVGDVEGLHPSPESVDQKDELKRKEMLRRAGLRARFVKAANENGTLDLGNSSWQIFMGDKLLFSKSVDEFTDGKSELMFNVVSSEEFGKDLISKFKVLGSDKLNEMFKKAQVPPPAPQGDTPPVPAMPAEAPEMPVENSEKDMGKDGDPKETAMALADEAVNLLSDLKEAVHVLTDEQAEMGNIEATASANPSLAALQKSQKELNGMLVEAINTTISGLENNTQELNSIVALYSKNAVNSQNKEFVNNITNSSFAETKEALAEAYSIFDAYVKYANGSYVLEKRAAEEREMLKQAQEYVEPENKEIMSMLDETGADLAELANALDDDMVEDDDSGDTVEDLLADDLSDLDDVDTNDAVMVPDAATAAAVSKENPNATVEVKKASTKEDRTALRAKLASEMKVNPMFYDFHPKGGVTPEFDVKVSDKLDVVENLEETHQQMMDLAKASPSVRKQAEQINELVAAGELSADNVDLLIQGGVDPEAVKYWKDFYGEAGPEGKEFANELVKEHAKAELEQEKEVYQVKLARAYELAYEMVDRELLAHDRQAIKSQVEEFMGLNDQGFESMKKVISQHPVSVRSAANKMPRVGVYEEVVKQASNESLTDLLDQAFSTTRKNRLF